MALFVQLTILALFVTLSYGNLEVSITPDVNELLIKGESAQVLKCSSSESGTLTWSYPKVNGVSSDHLEKTISENGQRRSIFEITNFTVPGEMHCEINTDGGNTYTDTIKLILVEERKVEPTYQYGNKSAILSCSIAWSESKPLSIEKVTWMRGDKAVSALPESGRFQTDSSNSLVIDDPKRGDIGLYTAVMKVKGVQTPYKCEVSFKEEKLDLNFSKSNATYVEKMEYAALSCTTNIGLEIKNVEWLKNDTHISKLENPDRFKVNPENYTLSIDSPKREDAGLYIARFTFEGLPEPHDCQVKFKCPPYVMDFTKSKNLIEKDKMELQCRVLGFPKAVVTWLKDDVPLNVSLDERIELHTLDGYKNARLVIKNIEFSDEGEYACHAFSSSFNQSDTKTITVRVKDKLAALWPFLGIVCEVIILCTIIFIYEKRRNKRAEQEENKAQEAFIKEQKEGIRHRNQKK
ncbi:hypothetical protein RRG08_051369 [Elysia crispata]|uniref:Ig-like domain-containing protein n=1 Tax=Elysia crispata TaxID=231223 RepID=A0AAE1B396_9GAST|nr:hypothetical protein RRG08_051369 [Elysia crispata]